MSRPCASHRQAEPHWQPWELFRHGRVPVAVRDWLLDEGSLTRRVTRFCPERFRVRVRHQGWGRPSAGERAHLGMGRVGTALIREVDLVCGGRPWVFARTLIPVTSLVGAARRLAYLRDKPLGAVLFSTPGVRRAHMEVADLWPCHRLFRVAVQGLAEVPRLLWGRRSLFLMENRPLLVHEIFLPTLLSAETHEHALPEFERPEQRTAIAA